MAATATEVLTAVSGIIAGLYPGDAIRTRKGTPGPQPESPLAGWTPADPNPCWVISAQEPEPIDTAGSFEHVSVGYVCIIAYVQPNLAKSGVQDDDAALRDKRAAVRAALYRPSLTGVGEVFDIRIQSGDPYAGQAGGSPVVSVSKETLTFSAMEAREHN